MSNQPDFFVAHMLPSCADAVKEISAQAIVIAIARRIIVVPRLLKIDIVLPEGER
jgi:hypothetical protein